MRKIIFFIPIFYFFGCVSFVEKTGQIIDGSAFNEKKIAKYKLSEKEILITENDSYVKFITISFKNYPMMKLRASFPDENNNFYFTSLEYLGGNVNGWNEFSMELLGSGNLVFENEIIISINEEIIKSEITNARIHRYDTRITGNEALTALRNRKERIFELTGWMLTLDAPKGQTIKEFEEYWKPILLPEITSKRKRPSFWHQDGDVFERAEDIRWNTGYTQRVFPHELIQVRNSGTLLRDWEEALSWIYMEYEWENIIKIISN